MQNQSSMALKNADSLSSKNSHGLNHTGLFYDENFLSGSKNEEASEDCQNEITKVQLINTPVKLYRKLKEYQDSLNREITLLGIQHSTSSDMQKLKECLEHLSALYHKYFRKALEAAEETGKSNVDLQYYLKEEDYQKFSNLPLLSKLADKLCSEGKLLTFMPDMLVLDLRKWCITELMQQKKGEAPNAWPDEGEREHEYLKTISVLNSRKSNKEEIFHLKKDPRSVAQARKVLAEILHKWQIPEDCVQTAVLLTSELVTNSILHGKSDFILSVKERDASPEKINILEVGVSDSSEIVPLVKRYTEGAATGRGLHLVESLANEWGVDTHNVEDIDPADFKKTAYASKTKKEKSSITKTVWFSLTVLDNIIT